MNILKFFKLSLALLLATTFFSCEEVKELTSPYRDGYLSGDGNAHYDYAHFNENTYSFYKSTSKGNIKLIRGQSGDTVTSYEYIQMAYGEYADDVEYVQITLNPDTADTTYSAEFTPNPKWTDMTVITDDDTNVITIPYPEGVERDEFIGMVKLSFTTTKDGVTEKDYFDIYNSDDVNGIFND